MALSGSFEKVLDTDTTKPGRGYTFLVDWNATQNVETNSSTIVCDFYLVRRPGFDIWISAKDNNCVIDGTTIQWTSNEVKDSTVPQTTVSTKIGSCSHTVSHNEDGTKRLTIKAVFNIKVTLGSDSKGNKTYYGDVVASSDIELDSILRGIVNIDTGAGFVKAIPYIHNGTEWKQCIPYVDTGSEFKMCGG